MDMKTELEALIGKTTGKRKIEYGWRESALYALSVGAHKDELCYVYKEGMKALPSFGVLPYWGAVGVEPFMELPYPATLLPMDIIKPEKTYLNMSHELIIHKPINPLGKSLNFEDELIDIYDRGEGKGVVSKSKQDVYDENGELLCTNYSTVYYFEGGGFGGKPMPKSDVVIPDTEPDFVVEDYISPVQNLLYRLTGDTNLIHVDSEYAKKTGLEAPIVQGLCSFGFATRMAIGALIPGQPERVTSISANMTSPLPPDTPVELRLWKIEEGKAYFEFININTGKAILGRGRICWK